VNIPQQYAHLVTWGFGGNTEATEMFVIVFPHSIQVVLRKLEDGLFALAGLNKLVFVSRRTGDLLHAVPQYVLQQPNLCMPT